MRDRSQELEERHDIVKALPKLAEGGLSPSLTGPRGSGESTGILRPRLQRSKMTEDIVEDLFRYIVSRSCHNREGRAFRDSFMQFDVRS